MPDRKPSAVNRRTFLKGSVAASALVGLGAPRIEYLRQKAVAAGIRSREWHTIPRNDGRTIETNATDLGGDFQLLRNADGSFQSSRTFVSDVQRTSGRFNMVGMRWVAHVPEHTTLEIAVRGSLDGATWSPWALVGHLMQGKGDLPNLTEETVSDVVEMGRANVMQYRITLTTSDPGRSPMVQRVSATQIDSLDSPRLEDLDQRGRAIPFRVGNGGAPTARLILRDGPNGWGPDFDPLDFPPDHPYFWDPLTEQHPYEFVTIHHTAGANNPENPVAAVRGVWYYHAVTNGWGDIGYHFVVDQYGNVYQGRDGGDGTEGGHAFRYNYYNCGIVLLGQFQPGATDVPYQGGEPTAAALDSAMRMAALEAAYHGFNPLEQHLYPLTSGSCRVAVTNYRICGHRDWGRSGNCIATACPGENVHKHLPAMRKQAAALIPQIKDLHLMEILNKR